jgi:hypothetical protein
VRGFFFSFFYSFIHMCIYCLCHFSPCAPPLPHPWQSFNQTENSLLLTLKRLLALLATVLCGCHTSQFVAVTFSGTWLDVGAALCAACSALAVWSWGNQAWTLSWLVRWVGRQKKTGSCEGWLGFVSLFLFLCIVLHSICVCIWHFPYKNLKDNEANESVTHF